MLHRAFALVLLLSAFSLESFAANASDKSGALANASASCPVPSVTVTVTAAAAGATSTAVAGAGKGSASNTGSNNAGAGAATGNNAGAGAAAGNNGGNNASAGAAAGNNGGNKGGNNAGAGAAAGNNGGNKGGNTGGNNAAAGAAAGNNAGNNAGGNTAAGNNAGAAAAAGQPVSATDPSQSSLTLLSSVVATGFESNGQETPTAGQVASLTSNNNFINYCATTKLPLTNGKQIKTGSCNPAPMGMIAPTTSMPQAKFVNPPNMGNIAANTKFTITMAIKNLDAGHFVNAQANYYSAPQQLNAQNIIVGHSHFVIEKLDSLTQTTPLDNSKFAFFQGVNTAADKNGNLNVDVTAGLPAGVYRLGSINAAANHQPTLVAVAQHGLLDDVVYFTVGGAGGNAGGNQGANAGANAGANNGTANAGANNGANAGANKGGNQGGKKTRDVDSRRSRRHFGVKRQL